MTDAGGTDRCITCADAGDYLTVLEVLGADAQCQDALGRREQVALELVGSCAPGDVLLVHAGVAIGRLT